MEKNDDNGNNRKKKKEFLKNNKKNQNEILAGFIITCDNHKEKNAINDAYNILNEFTEKLYPNIKLKKDLPPVKKNKTEEEKTESKIQMVSDLLDEELNQLKEKDERFFYTHDIGVKKGVVFIKVNTKFPEISPYVLCDAIMKEAHEKKNELSRFCHKIIPIEKAFSASFETFKTLMLEILQKNFKSEENLSWFLEFKSRNNSKFKQKEFLDFILENIGKNHHVSYKEPEITLFVEIDQGTMCLAALPHFFEYNKYSLRGKNAKIAQKPKIEKKPEEDEKKETNEQNEKLMGDKISDKSNEDEDEIRLL